MRQLDIAASFAVAIAAVIVAIAAFTFTVQLTRPQPAPLGYGTHWSSDLVTAGQLVATPAIPEPQNESSTRSPLSV